MACGMTARDQSTKTGLVIHWALAVVRAPTRCGFNRLEEALEGASRDDEAEWQCPEGICEVDGTKTR